jgi:hypothetical protein
MLRYERDGDRMTRDEIVANTKLMLSGGLQEPRDLIALTVWALGSNPEQLARVRGDRSLVKAAVEETLRWAGPVGTSTRQTTAATELAGIELEQGALIGAVLSSANRDPRRFTDPDRFDIGRKEGAHLAFAIGSHFCLGAWFGRHLARVSLNVLLDRLPSLRLDPDRPITLAGWEFRAPDSTWVRWDPPDRSGGERDHAGPGGTAVGARDQPSRVVGSPNEGEPVRLGDEPDVLDEDVASGHGAKVVPGGASVGRAEDVGEVEVPAPSVTVVEETVPRSTRCHAVEAPRPRRAAVDRLPDDLAQ